MLEKILQEKQVELPGAQQVFASNTRIKQLGPVWLSLSAAGLVACFLLMMTPLIRVPDPVLTLHFVAGEILARASNWLPEQLGGLQAATSAYGEFFGLLSLAFLCYALGALLVRHQMVTENQRVVRGLIWLGTLLVGSICVVTPAALSHDTLVYASYSRILSTYHANPYFVPISAFPRDHFTIYNYWASAVSAYGPIWMLICGCFGWFLQPDQNAYTLAFRIFALLFALVNLWLVGHILQTLGRSARTVTLGMLLYAWNPLLLLESGLGGHNDDFMMTFVLIGILLAAGAEKRGQMLRPRGYLPVVALLTLAALVKFTALPVLATYLLFLFCKALRQVTESPRETLLQAALRHWRAARSVLTWSLASALLLALVFYGPFWLGHNFAEIITSFKTPPSSLYAENSFMRSVAEWQNQHLNEHNGLLDLLSNRHFWDALTIVGIAFCLLVGSTRLWRKPTTRTFILVALATLSLVLLVTPWFFAWYLNWLLGLGILCLPVRLNRIEAALLALVFTFSFSALFTYLFNGNLFGSSYYLISLFTTIPPVCAFLLTLVCWQAGPSEKTGAKEL
ncbi:MAG TPA: hypothetical protein VGD98_26390 [Ktedonobacteraceae bacterium]